MVWLECLGIASRIPSRTSSSPKGSKPPVVAKRPPPYGADSPILRSTSHAAFEGPVEFMLVALGCLLLGGGEEYHGSHAVCVL